MWKTYEQLIKGRGKWADLIRRIREREWEINEQRPDDEKLSKQHMHYRTYRRSMRLFLQKLWEKWRELEGLESRVPYAIEYLGHSKESYFPPFTD